MAESPLNLGAYLNPTVNNLQGYSVSTSAPTDGQVLGYNGTQWAAQFNGASIPGGRLSLTTGVPVTTSDVTAATTLYYVPYTHDGIELWDGTAWRKYLFTELPLSLSAYTAAKPFDIFGYLNSGSPALESLVWTDATTRATALARVNGRLVKSGTTSRLYLGTIYTSATGQTEDSIAKRFVWNFYNRTQITNFTRDTTDSWTYNGNGTWRQSNNGNSAWKHELVVGVSEDAILGTACISAINNNASSPSLTMGLDTTTTPNTAISGMAFNQSGVYNPIVVQLATIPSEGYHYISTMESTSASGNSTFLGDNGGTIGGGNVGSQAYMTTTFRR